LLLSLLAGLRLSLSTFPALPALLALLALLPLLLLTLLSLLLLAALTPLLLLASAPTLLLLVAHLGFLGTVTLRRVALLFVLLLRLRRAFHGLRGLLHAPLCLVQALRARFGFLLLQAFLQFLHFLGQVLRPFSHFFRGTLRLGAVGSVVGARQ
jgi:hypothetical protein